VLRITRDNIVRRTDVGQGKVALSSPAGRWRPHPVCIRRRRILLIGPTLVSRSEVESFLRLRGVLKGLGCRMEIRNRLQTRTATWSWASDLNA
jgi:hypothetical protein